jgi:hypothetical protein
LVPRHGWRAAQSTALVGWDVGRPVGGAEGAADGAEEGGSDGAEEGDDEGAEDGAEEGGDEGASDGAEDGAAEGADDGAGVGLAAAGFPDGAGGLRAGAGVGSVFIRIIVIIILGIGHLIIPCILQLASPPPPWSFLEVRRPGPASLRVAGGLYFGAASSPASSVPALAAPEVGARRARRKAASTRIAGEFKSRSDAARTAARDEQGESVRKENGTTARGRKENAATRDRNPTRTGRETTRQERLSSRAQPARQREREWCLLPLLTLLLTESPVDRCRVTRGRLVAVAEDKGGQ